MVLIPSGIIPIIPILAFLFGFAGRVTVIFTNRRFSNQLDGLTRSGPWVEYPMQIELTSQAEICSGQDEDRERRADYFKAYSRFGKNLKPADRAKINGSASPDWESKRTFALPITPDSPAFRSEPGDPVIETLDELAGLNGALPKIVLWLNDRVGSNNSAMAVEQFRMAISRICSAKIPRLEATLIGLAIGLNLHGNANGYAIAAHFGLKPQTIHEMLGDTCLTLGLAKPLSKANTKRYAKTQYRHQVRPRAAKAA